MLSPKHKNMARMSLSWLLPKISLDITGRAILKIIKVIMLKY